MSCGDLMPFIDKSDIDVISTTDGTNYMVTTQKYLVQINTYWIQK